MRPDAIKHGRRNEIENAHIGNADDEIAVEVEGSRRIPQSSASGVMTTWLTSMPRAFKCERMDAPVSSSPTMEIKLTDAPSSDRFSATLRATPPKLRMPSDRIGGFQHHLLAGAILAIEDRPADADSA